MSEEKSLEVGKLYQLTLQGTQYLYMWKRPDPSNGDWVANIHDGTNFVLLETLYEPVDSEGQEREWLRGIVGEQVGWFSIRFKAVNTGGVKVEVKEVTEP